jgi:putative membrane protein insertion efficiency factor
MAKYIKKIEIITLRYGKRFFKTLFCIPDGSCKFRPTCSEYAEMALQNYNIFKAAFLIIWRLCRCNPLSRGGYDPIEERR